MKTKTIVIGHINPDADSVISAILVAKFSKKIFGFEAESRIAGNLNSETKYILDLVKEKKPKVLKKITKENVILVDTTEPNQIVEGLTEDNLVGIIDHHNLGGLKSSKPIYIRTENLGCVCSLIYKILSEKNVKINKKVALLMMSGIISDTLKLTSPTTTKDDKKILKELAQIANVNINDFASKLFEAKSSLKGISTVKIVDGDYKEFEMSGKKIGIGVWETTDVAAVEAKKENIIKVMQDKKKSKKLDCILFGVVDIVKNDSYCYIAGEQEKTLIENVFEVQEKEKCAFLKGIVSRKKQLVPPLMQYFAKK